MKKFISMNLLVFYLIFQLFPIKVFAESSRVDEILLSMSNEDKIAQMIMPSFRKQSGGSINEENIRDLLSTYGFAGVILFAENISDIDSTMRFIQMLQDANRNHPTRLLIATDQEGGYVTRLSIGTSMPGNMALAATNHPDYAYQAAKVMGKELNAMGINVDFAPVVDVNSNPSNPVIGIRSFSDDPFVVSNFGEAFMKGLQSEGISTSLKHFPGYGDTSVDTHTGISIIYKTYDELKNMELIPFQKLIQSGTDMIMTAHIQYPNIEKETYVSLKDGNTYTLPATLSKTLLTDILRNDMGYQGVVVTDALDMKSISDNFNLIDASIKAINAGVDILLMPFRYDSQKEELKSFIQTLADKIGTEISLERVNQSVRRILTLKEKKGLLEEFDSSNIDGKIQNAKTIISTRENHNEEFEIAKKSITMIKNENHILPLKTNDKTIAFYEYSSHIEAVHNAINILKEKEGIDFDISLYPFYNKDGVLDLEDLKNQVKGYKNVIVIHSLYGTDGLSDPDLVKMNELIDYVHSIQGNVVFYSTHLPYDAVQFMKADSIVLSYLANGIRFQISDYEKEIPKYGANVIAGIYMMLTGKENMNGVLPVHLYEVDSNYQYTSKILYERGFGLKYLEKANLVELMEEKNRANEVLQSDVEYTKESIDLLKNTYEKVFKYLEEYREPLEDQQAEIDSLVQEMKTALEELQRIYKIIDGDHQKFNNQDVVITANGDLNRLVMIQVDGKQLDSSFYTVDSGSTIVTLKKDYLGTLSVGNHTLTFVYSDGQVDATFTIPSNIVKNPNTGDGIMNYFILMIASCMGMITMLVFHKKFLR